MSVLDVGYHEVLRNAQMVIYNVEGVYLKGVINAGEGEEGLRRKIRKKLIKKQLNNDEWQRSLIYISFEVFQIKVQLFQLKIPTRVLEGFVEKSE